MSAASDSTAGVSRRLLVRSPVVQRITGVMLIVAGALTWGGAAVLTESLTRGLPALAFGALAGLVVLAVQPPSIGTAGNHLQLAAGNLLPVLAYWQLLPGGAPALGAFAIVGVVTPFRLVDRRQIAGHLLLVATLVVVPLLFDRGHDLETEVGVAILLPLMVAIAVAVTLVLESAEQQGGLLAALSRRDPLTGAGNRRLLAERLEYEVSRHRRSGGSFAVIAFDLDGFKTINDTIGHAAGDAVLCAVARELQRALRQQDTVVRQGGDEFCALLPETDRAAAEALAPKLRAALAGIDAGGRPLGAGSGVAAFPDDGDTLDALMRAADARLLADKAATRSELRRGS